MIRTRAAKLAKADKDVPVDGQSECFLAIVVPAACRRGFL